MADQTLSIAGLHWHTASGLNPQYIHCAIVFTAFQTAYDACQASNKTVKKFLTDTSYCHVVECKHQHTGSGEWLSETAFLYK